MRTGGGLAYIHELFPELRRVAERTRVLVTREQRRRLDWPSSDSVYELPDFVALPIMRLLFEMAVLPWLLKLWKSDAVLMCGNVGMPFCPTRQVVVQHASFAAGASATRLQRVKWAILRWVATHTARTADAVVYVSASLRDELMQLGFPQGTIIRHGVNAVFHPMPADVARENVRRSFAVEPPFLLCVADIYAHKNLGLAIEVLARLHAEKHSELLLVVAGSVRDAQEYERLRHAAEESGIAQSVRWLGSVTREDLASLYNAAQLVLLPSRAESFGMPILEALACGTPVVCSRIPAFQEVAGDAGRFFDTNDATEATAQVAAALLQSRPYAQGVSHAHGKRWSDAARSTFEVLTTV